MMLRMLRIKWNNRHFAREVNAQLAQYRQYKKLLESASDPDDAEFYLAECNHYYTLISERTGLDPDKVRRFRVR